MTVYRFDHVELRLDKATPTDEGWLRVPASIGTVGIFPYRRADGSIRMELRPPEEVLHEDSLRSFSAIPVTNSHPATRLDSSNVDRHQVGQTATAVAQGDHVVNDVLLTKDEAIAAARRGKNQLSPGYTVELDETPGVWRGQRYDAVQRRIRGNHVALVDLGRQGPSVSLRMDSGDAVAINDNEDTDMKKIKLDDGTEVEVSDAVHAQITKLREDAAALEDHTLPSGAVVRLAKTDGVLVAREIAEVVAKTTDKADAGDEGAKLLARVDALESQLKTAKAEARADAMEFADALSHARTIIGPEYKADGKDIDALMRDVVLKLDESAEDQLEAHKKSSGYLKARYDVALEQYANRKNSGSRLLEAAKLAGSKGSDRKDAAAEAKAKAEAERSNAWKAPAA